MSLRSVFFASCIAIPMAFSTSAAAFETYDTVGNWQLGVHPNNLCGALARFSNDYGEETGFVQFILSPNIFRIQFLEHEWELRDGREYGVVLEVDDFYQHYFRAETHKTQNGASFITIDAQGETAGNLVVALQDGYELTLQTQNQIYTYPLQGSHKAIQRTAQCTLNLQEEMQERRNPFE